MKYTLILSLITLATLLFVACTPKANNGGDSSEYNGANSYPFQTIANGSYCGVGKAQNVIITDVKSWDKLWDDTYSIEDPKPMLPQVNFEMETVVGVYMGMRNSGGYGIEVPKIIDTGNELQILVKEITPAKGAMSTMALTQPFHLIKLDTRENKKIVFK